jgi:acetyltransferase-like isoleucine patch superfamily enzyme
MATMITINGIKIHPTAEVSDLAEVGAGTSIWNQAQIRENASVGENCVLAKDVYVAENVQIGNNVKTQNGVSIYMGVTIEDDVFLGPHMTFTNDRFPRSFIKDYKVYPTLVKKGASIGANATVICGTTIGEYAMIGAGAVVTKDVPSHALVVGNPGHVIGFVCRCGRRLIEVEEKNQGILMACEECSEKLTIEKNIYQLKK